MIRFIKNVMLLSAYHIAKGTVTSIEEEMKEEKKKDREKEFSFFFFAALHIFVLV